MTRHVQKVLGAHFKLFAILHIQVYTHVVDCSLVCTKTNIRQLLLSQLFQTTLYPTLPSHNHTGTGLTGLTCFTGLWKLGQHGVHTHSLSIFLLLFDSIMAEGKQVNIGATSGRGTVPTSNYCREPVLLLLLLLLPD